VNDPRVLDQVIPRLPPGWRRQRSPFVRHLYSLLHGGPARAPGVRRFHLLYGGGARLARSLVLDEVLDVFESDLKLQVAAGARGRLFVHAGVVGWRGRAILMPGRSHSGKSRLVEAFLRAGAAYYSDEYAVLDRRGRVHPYPAPLTRRGGDGEPSRRYTPAELGGVAGKAPLPVGLVVVAAHRPGARWRPRRLTPGRGVLALLNHTVPARGRPADALATLARLCSRAPVLQGARGEAAETVARLLKALP
jgi:hypothetical protein